MLTTLTTDFLTASTVGYLPQAMTTLRSARRHNHDGSYFFFAVDAPPSTVMALRALLKDESWLRIFGPHDLGMGMDTFLRAFDYFSPIEMCCLAKYVGIQHVLSLPGAADCCVFADSDVMFFDSLRDPLEELGDVAFLLTPHQFGPSTDAAEHEYLQSGWVNAGFIAVQQSHADAQGILGWLVDRITLRGFFAPALGLYCDQSWLSLLPLAFSGRVALGTHPGMNVAYWNLSERELSVQDEIFLANGVPLVFFHFSGFDGLQRNRLSKHAEVIVTPGTVLGDICAQYKAEMVNAVPLQSAIADLETLPCSRDDLLKRIDKGSVVNRIDIGSPGAPRGFFARIGGKIDSAFRHLKGR